MFKFDIFWILVFFITIVLIYLSFVKLIKTKKVNYMPVVHFFLYLMSIFKAPTISNCILGIKWLMYLVVEYKLNTSGLAFVYDNAVFVAVIAESYSFLFGCRIHKYTSSTWILTHILYQKSKKKAIAGSTLNWKFRIKNWNIFNVVCGVYFNDFSP